MVAAIIRVRLESAAEIRQCRETPYHEIAFYLLPLPLHAFAPWIGLDEFGRANPVQLMVLIWIGQIFKLFPADR